MTAEEQQAVAQELIDQVTPMFWTSFLFMGIALFVEEWNSVLILCILLGVGVGGWAAMDPARVPTAAGPDWRGVEQPSQDEVERRRAVLAAQSRQHMRYIIASEVLVGGALLVWSLRNRSFAPTLEFAPLLLLFLAFFSGVMVTATLCWLSVYYRMRRAT